MEILQRAILLELTNRKNLVRSVTDFQFPKQALFVESKSKLIAGFCTRRAGKSYGVGLKLYNAALQNPGVSCVYIALTRDSAKRIMLKDVMKDIDRKHNLGAKFNHTELSITMPNGSIIYLLGMDSDKREMDKVLGQKFKLAVIDECGSFRQNVREIVYSKLRPACADLDGTIVIIGTPQNLTAGLFYDVVWAKTEPGWEIHEWSAFDNPYMRDKWQQEIDDILNANPETKDTPWFQQNYLGRYVVDTNSLCYRFDAKKNLIAHAKMPTLNHYVLGVDLGYEDATAFSLLGYEQDGGKLYVVQVKKQKHMTLTAVAEMIEWFQFKYRPYKIIVDNAAKQAVEEMKTRFQLPLVAAEKQGKADFIEIMNNDFVAGNIMVSDSCVELISEYQNLIWDDQSDRKQEHPNCDNHLADATLYPYRYCYNYVKNVRKTVRNEVEKLEHWEEEITKGREKKSWMEAI